MQNHRSTFQEYYLLIQQSELGSWFSFVLNPAGELVGEMKEFNTAPEAKQYAETLARDDARVIGVQIPSDVIPQWQGF